MSDSLVLAPDGKVLRYDIEVFYNQQRRHSSIGYASPANFERAAGESRLMAA